MLTYIGGEAKEFEDSQPRIAVQRDSRDTGRAGRTFDQPYL
jgi:hypothetical protein